MFASLRSRLILFVLLVLALTQLLTAAYTLNTMETHVRSDAEDRLLLGSRVFNNAIRVNGEQITNAMDILADDRGFKTSLLNSNSDEVRLALNTRAHRMGAELAFVMTEQGIVLGSNVSSLVTGKPFPIPDFKDHVRDRGYTVDVTVVNGKLYEMVAVPLELNEPMASMPKEANPLDKRLALVMAFPMNQEMAHEVSAITNLDLSFLGYDNGSQLVMASTLSADATRAIEQEVDKQRPPINQLFTTGSGRFRALMVPLATVGNEPVFALLYLDNHHLQMLSAQLQKQLIMVFFITVLLGVVVAFPLSRSVSGPVKELAEFATAVGRGESSRPPRVIKGEIGMLNQTLQQMQANIRHREEQLTFQSSHDDLTGLMNRVAMTQYLRKLLLDPSRPEGTVMQICIRDFKEINNALGYQNGDDTLCEFSRRLAALPVDAVSRHGGDEFFIVSTGHLGPELIEDLLKPLVAPMVIQGTQLSLRVATGVVYFPDQGRHVNELGRRADIAINLAKQNSLSLFFYKDGLDESHRRELRLIRDLRRALANGEIYLVYQPKITLITNRCNAVEAMIRWLHPELGVVPPDEFIRLAEHSGNIGLVTRWVMGSAMDQIQHWHDAGREMKVAVNLSVRDLSDPAFLPEVQRLIDRNPTASRGLMFEVTESQMMTDAERVIKTLQQLRAMGFPLAIDDFGTGHSSLAYLKRLPVDELKIDKSFIKNISDDDQNRLIVATTIRLAHAMGMTVTAEGIEEKDSLETLQAMGCDTVQGFYFTKPLPPAKLEAWIDGPNDLIDGSPV
ncbi:putative bifunctional diguanylate cyclase/phosphodiesterase [Pokkaliibacter sp. CJK22405]|uniref:putative bifunctional diguanylate cyclase/phosphodiesterase n=1 Tax=Pokkaliibacter sp. CJK22405 TaxID=3384615 RepID=UPI0039853FA4